MRLGLGGGKFGIRAGASVGRGGVRGGVGAGPFSLTGGSGGKKGSGDGVATLFLYAIVGLLALIAVIGALPAIPFFFQAVIPVATKKARVAQIALAVLSYGLCLVASLRQVSRWVWATDSYSLDEPSKDWLLWVWLAGMIVGLLAVAAFILHKPTWDRNLLHDEENGVDQQLAGVRELDSDERKSSTLSKIIGFSEVALRWLKKGQRLILANSVIALLFVGVSALICWRSMSWDLYEL